MKFGLQNVFQEVCNIFLLEIVVVIWRLAECVKGILVVVAAGSLKARPE